MRSNAPFHIVIGSILILLFSFQSAKKDLAHAFQSLEEKDFITAERLFNKILLDNPTSAGAYFGLASLYAHSEFVHRNPQRSLEYLASTAKNMATLRDKELNRLEKYGVNAQRIKEMERALGEEIVQKAFADKSMDDLEAAIKQFAHLPEVLNLAYQRRDELAFAEAEQVNTYQAFQAFMVKYPTASQVPEARQRYEQLLYQSFAKINTLVAYEQFLTNYPQSPYYQQAKEEYEQLLYANLTQQNTLEAYQNFIRDHPRSPFLEKVRWQLSRFDMRLPVRISGRWGFVNGRGELIIDPVYEKTGVFSSGLARVKRNGKWGYIDSRGNQVIDMKFDGARDFSDGLAIVMVKKPRKDQYQTFFIDTNGNPAFDRVYETNGAYMPIHSFSEGFAAVVDPGSDKLGFINKKGDYVVAPLFTPKIDRGNNIFEYPFSGFKNGFAWVKDAAKEGLIDHKGIFLLQGVFTQPYMDTLHAWPSYRYSFEEGLCLVKEKGHDSSFYIDTSGNKVISLPSGSVGLPFSNQVAWVKLPVPYQYQLIDKTGKVITEITAQQVRPYHEGFAAVQTKAPEKRVYFYDEVPEGTYVYLDKNGKQVFDFKFHLLNDPAFPFLNGAFNQGIAGILLDGKQTYINGEGYIIWQSEELW